MAQVEGGQHIEGVDRSGRERPYIGVANDLGNRCIHTLDAIHMLYANV
jgi:hypothetical protein